MSGIGFITRRVIKEVVHSAIDTLVDDKDTAKTLKTVANVGITAVGIGVSIATADVIGVGDALLDHGTDIAIDHGTDLLTDHGTDLVDHATSSYDPSNHGDYSSSYSYNDHTGSSYDTGNPTTYDNGAQGSHDLKFGGSDKCYQCSDNPPCYHFLPEYTGKVDDDCRTCGDPWRQHG